MKKKGKTTTKRNVKKMISKAIRQASEVKFFDHLHSGLIVTNDLSTTAMDDILYPPQGVQEQQRVGNKIRIQSVQIRGRFSYINTAGAANKFGVRMLLVQWKPMSNGSSSPLASSILSTSTGANQINAPILPNDMHNMTIVFDKTYQLNTSDEPGSIKHFEFYWTKFNKFFDREVKFNGNASVDGTNKLYLKISFYTRVPYARLPKIYIKRIRKSIL